LKNWVYGATSGVQGKPITSPVNRQQRLGSWKALIRARQEGLCRHIGVSNFEESHLTQLLEDMESSSMDLVIPFCNQFELHPLCTKVPLRQYCETLGIQVQAYSSLGSGAERLLGHPVVVQIASECRVSVTEVLLCWAVQQQIGVIPKSRSKERLSVNLLKAGVLNEVQIEALSNINENVHFCWDPSTIS
jgi:diketogulonate reductase-like aldo/keto reductase